MVEPGVINDSFDYHTSIMSLPGILKTDLDSIPPVPNLYVPDACEQELANAGAQELVLELGVHLNDFADTASVLKQLDLVIMTDSSVAHLAGSLGCPVWNLLPYHAYWLYLSKREDCPWYRSMTLIRQTEPGDWDTVFKEAGGEASV